MKVMKVKHEPELFKAFNYSAQVEKPFVQMHMATMRRQLSTIVRQAIASKLIKAKNVDDIVSILFEGTIGFHHPAMVVMHMDENREPMLKDVLDTLIEGLCR